MLCCREGGDRGCTEPKGTEFTEESTVELQPILPVALRSTIRRPRLAIPHALKHKEDVQHAVFVAVKTATNGEVGE
jgi:hypothetical protein